MNCSEKLIIPLVVTFLVWIYQPLFGQVFTTTVSKREIRSVLSKAKREGHSEAYVSAYKNYLHGNYNEAIELLTPLDSTNNDHLILLTSCYLTIEDNEHANTLMKYYIKHNKPVKKETKNGNDSTWSTIYPEEYETVTRNLAIDYFWNYEEDSALYYINESLKIVSDPESFWFRGFIQEDLGHGDQACLDYYTAMQLGYDSAQVYYDQGNCVSWKDTWLPLAYTKSEEVASYQSHNEKMLRKIGGRLAVGKQYSLQIDGKATTVVLKKIYFKNFGLLLVFMDDTEKLSDVWLPFTEATLNWEVRYTD